MEQVQIHRVRPRPRQEDRDRGRRQRSARVCRNMPGPGSMQRPDPERGLQKRPREIRRSLYSERENQKETDRKPEHN